MKENSKVTSTEYPGSEGQVMRMMENGASIEWSTPKSEDLPYGHKITEFWPSSDFHLLEVSC